MQPGIYVLVLAGEAESLKVGYLGEIAFPAGFYCYTGSALGPGGLARVLRHIRLAENHDKGPRWHVDYLLVHPEFRLEQVYCAGTCERLECMLASGISLPVIRGFGSSDCSCPGHLFFSHTHPGEVIESAFRKTGLVPVKHSF